MKTLVNSLSLLFLIGISGCKKNHEETIPDICHSQDVEYPLPQRNFFMGFSTWSFGPEINDRISTYSFIDQQADIYSEQMDAMIPWKALINGDDFPEELKYDIEFRATHRLKNHKMILSVSLLNLGRDDLLSDYDGFIPQYSSLSDTIIEIAYTKYLTYLIQQLNPDFLIAAMEVNELLIHSPLKWSGYKELMKGVRKKIKDDFPDLRISESITLHKWYNPEVENPLDYLNEINSYTNSLDFSAISFYPFLKGMRTREEFQMALDFINQNTSNTIAFTETAHIAEDLDIENYSLHIPGSNCEQKEYLETLFLNAMQNNYEFIIWWSHRDYDQLWKTFPDDLKDIGQLWKDTGLLDENGKERPAYHTWKAILSKKYSN